MAAPKISFSEKDFQTIKLLVEDGNFDDLKNIYKKMLTAMKPKPEFTFDDKQARVIANQILGDDVYFATALPSQVVKHNKYFRSFNVTDEVFTKACKVAQRTWRKPIFYDTLAMSAYKLAAQPLFNTEPVQPKNVFGTGDTEEE